MKKRFQTIFWMACVPFLLVPKLHSESNHVFYVFQHGLSHPLPHENHVHELYYTDGGAVSDIDLTAATNSPAAANSPWPALTSFFDGSIEHVFYVSGDWHVRELSYNATAPFSIWWGNDLTAATNGPAAYPISLTSFFDGTFVHVFYTSFADHHVHELFYGGGPVITGWGDNDVTAATNTPPVGPLTSFFDGSIEHVFCVSQGDYHVRELYYTNGKWWSKDLTAATNGPPSDGSSLTGFLNGSSENVFYVSSLDRHVRKLYYNGGNWWGTDLTAATNGPPVAQSISGESQQLTSFFDGTFEHVFYVSGDRHLHELYYSFGGWFGEDLTPVLNGDGVEYGAQLTSFFDGSIGHVFYLSESSYDVVDLYCTKGKWWSKDLGYTSCLGVVCPLQLTSFFVP